MGYLPLRRLWRAAFARRVFEVAAFDGDVGPGARWSSTGPFTSPCFTHHALDIRDREAVARLVADVAPQAVIHCAAQPSHDLARDRPFDDFEINAVGTLRGVGSHPSLDPRGRGRRLRPAARG